MRTALCAAALALLIPTAALAGDHENHMKDVDPIEEGDYRIDFSDQHCQEEFVMVKAEITNNSSDYLIVRKEAAVFEVDGKDVQPYDGKKKKPLIIKPRSSKKNTYKVKADGGYHVEEFSLKLAGFYSAAEDGDPIEAPEFVLPASINNFEAGPFDCKLKGLKQETKETVARFSCKYNGDAIGFIDSSQLGVRIESGQEFANVDRKASKNLLEPGGSYSFNAVFKIEYKIIDMQFATMHVVWRETFSESPLEEVDMGSVDFELDEAKTAEKND